MIDEHGPPEQAIPATDSAAPAARLAAFSWGDYVVAVALGLLLFAVYVYLLAPGLLLADAAEFQTLAVTLGYAHPTGYPVYLLLAKAATMIPAGDYAYRVNLLSAMMGAVAVGVMYLLGRLLTGRHWLPVAGALALGLSPTFWSQSLVAATYTLAMVCLLTILLWLALWQVTRQTRWLFAAGCLGGISLGIHTLVAFGAPAALLLIALERRRWKANWSAAGAGAAAGAALTLAAFWVIDRADSPCSYFNVVINPSRSEWRLRPEDTDSFLKRVRLSMSAPQFQGMLWSQTPARTWEKTREYFSNLPRELPLLWLALSAVGFVWLVRRNWQVVLLLTITYLAHLTFNIQFNGIVYIKYMATYAPLAAFGVAGLAAASDACQALGSRLFPRQTPPAAYDALLAAAGVVVVVWPMLWPGAWNIEGRRDCWVPPEEQDTPFRVEYCTLFHKDIRAFHREVRLLMARLEYDAIVFTGWDCVYPYYYVAHIEQGRDGILILHDYPTANHFELANSALEFIKQVKRDTPTRPIFFTHVVGKVAALYRFEKAYEGIETLYRVGDPLNN